MKNSVKIIILFLFFIISLSAQEKEKTLNKNYIMVNGGGCTNCTIDRSLKSMQQINIAIDEEQGSLISFKVKIPGQATVLVHGNKSNAAYSKIIKRAKVGNEMQIFDLKTKNGTLKSSIIIELTR